MITKTTNDFSRLDFKSGEVILFDKPMGWTSFKAVYEVRRAVEVKRVGHAGTLDPLATGLLIICTGRETKEISRFQEMKKTYAGKIILGKTSPSMDMETEITEIDFPDRITIDQILEARDSFVGKIMQVPPMYSAVKINGKTLYKIARKGKEVVRAPREVEVHKFEIKKISLPEIEFEIVCSKGTYIRSIANDLGAKLNCGGILGSLRRTAIGEYSVDDALGAAEFTSKMKAVALKVA